MRGVCFITAGPSTTVRVGGSIQRGEEGKVLFESAKKNARRQIFGRWLTVQYKDSNPCTSLKSYEIQNVSVSTNSVRLYQTGPKGS
jgi:hypothetical protein